MRCTAYGSSSLTSISNSVSVGMVAWRFCCRPPQSLQTSSCCFKRSSVNNQLLNWSQSPWQLGLPVRSTRCIITLLHTLSLPLPSSLPPFPGRSNYILSCKPNKPASSCFIFSGICIWPDFQLTKHNRII